MVNEFTLNVSDITKLNNLISSESKTMDAYKTALDRKDAATAVSAVPVERTNGVLSTVYRDDFELSNINQHHFVAFNRGCPGCRGGLVPHPFAYRYPYHLNNAYEERSMVKRSPEKFSKKFGKKSLFSIKKGGKKTGKKGGKGFKKTAVPPFNKPFKGFSKFGKKTLAKAGKPGTPQNKKAKRKAKKGGKKAKKGGKKGTKGFSKAAKKSSPISIPTLGLGGGGAAAFGVPGSGFAGFAVPGLAQAGFDYIAG